MVGTEAVERVGERCFSSAKGKQHRVMPWALSRENFPTTCRTSTNQGQPTTAPPHTPTTQGDPDFRAAVPSRLQEQGGWAALTGPPEQKSAKQAEGSWGSRKCLALDREGLEPGIQSSLHPTPIQLCTFQDCWEPRAVHSLDSASEGSRWRDRTVGASGAGGPSLEYSALPSMEEGSLSGVFHTGH